ncbi:MAG: hypothetical protein ACOC56_06010 [Atribacterota bacterium]
MSYRVICPICSAEVEFNYNYCPYCGASLPYTATTDNTDNDINLEDPYSNPWIGDYWKTCEKCGNLYFGEKCPICSVKKDIEKLGYNTPTNAELRDKINEIIVRLNENTN